MPLTGFEEITTHTDIVNDYNAEVLVYLLQFTIDDPVPSKQIEHHFGLAGPQVRAIVHQLRERGYAIGSGAKGYFVARTPAELDHTIEHLEQRVRSIGVCMSSLKEARKRMVARQTVQPLSTLLDQALRRPQL